VLESKLDESVIVTDGNHPAKFLLRPILVVLLICLAIGCVLVAVRRAEADRRACMATLPDGSKLELLGTVAGGAPFTTDTGWRHIVRRFLPARFQDWLPVFDGATNPNTESNVVTVFLRRTTSPGTAGAGQPWDDFAAEDQDGFRYHGTGSSSSSSVFTGISIHGFVLPGYPRRQQEFLLRLLDKNGGTMAAFTVPNPLRGPFPDWRPLSLPQTQTNGPVTLTLESLQNTTNRSWRFVNAEYHLRATDPAWTNAQPDFQTPSDPTGNEGAFVSPREPAWKFPALVDRSRLQDFAASEQFVLTNLPPPSPGQFLALDRSADCAGVGLKALVLAGAGTFGISNGTTRFMRPPTPDTGNGHRRTTNGPVWVEEWFSSEPFLLIEAQNIQLNDEIQLYLRDEHGREVKAKPWRINQARSGAHRVKLPFSPPAGWDSLSISLTVSRPLSFDFLVNPADVPTTKYKPPVFSDH
jgi:hypothetical protein